MFYFGKVGIEELVEPADKFCARHIDGVVGIESDLVYHF